MNNLTVLPESELPYGFKYPHQYLNVISMGVSELTPWYFLSKDVMPKVLAGLSLRYPEYLLVPFARRQDNDDIACWEVNAPERFQIIHDFAGKGWERRETFSTFYGWLKKALDDLIEFDCVVAP